MRHQLTERIVSPLCCAAVLILTGGMASGDVIYNWVNDPTSGSVPVASFSLTDADYQTAIASPGTFVDFSTITARYDYPGPQPLEPQSFTYRPTPDPYDKHFQVALTASGDVMHIRHFLTAGGEQAFPYVLLSNVVYPPYLFYKLTWWDPGLAWDAALQGGKYEISLVNHAQGTGRWVQNGSSSVRDAGSGFALLLASMLALITYQHYSGRSGVLRT